jgi:hypothetical protein
MAKRVLKEKTESVAKKQKKQKKPWIDVTEKELNSITLDEKPYLLVWCDDGQVEYIVAPSGEKRTSADIYFLKSILVYRQKTFVDDPPFRHDGTDTHICTLLSWIGEEDLEDIEDTYAEKLTPILRHSEFKDCKSFFPQLSKEWKNIGESEVSELTKKVHFVVEQVDKII